MKKPGSVRWSYLLTQVHKCQSWTLTPGLTALKACALSTRWSCLSIPQFTPMTLIKGREYTTCSSNWRWIFSYIKSKSLLQPYLCLISFKTTKLQSVMTPNRIKQKNRDQIVLKTKQDVLPSTSSQSSSLSSSSSPSWLPLSMAASLFGWCTFLQALVKSPCKDHRKKKWRRHIHPSVTLKLTKF